MTKEKFQQALEKVTEILEPADLRFAFDPEANWKPRKSTLLNSLDNGSGGKWWEGANKVTAQHKGRLVIFLRMASRTPKVSTDLCGGPASFKIAGVGFSPDRSNVMSYFRCPPVTMSPKQIGLIRQTLDHLSDPT